MKLVGVLRSTETKNLEVEAASYPEAKAMLEAQLPEGWQIQSIREAD